MTLLSQLSQPGLGGDSDSDSLDSLGSDSELDERPGESGGRPTPAEMTAVLGDEGRWRYERYRGLFTRYKLKLTLTVSSLG